jgi:hypothetical protein
LVGENIEIIINNQMIIISTVFLSFDIDIYFRKHRGENPMINNKLPFSFPLIWTLV